MTPIDGPPEVVPASSRSDASPKAGSVEDRLGKVAAAVLAFQQGAESTEQEQEREQSFRVVFEHFRPALLRFFGRKGIGEPESHDLTQETLLRVYKDLEGFRGESQLSTWVFRIATTVYWKHLRSAGAQKRQGEEISQSQLEDVGIELVAEDRPLDQVLERERRQALEEAVQELPPKMRQCLLLRVRQDLSVRQVAALLKLSRETVKAQLFQARKRLRAVLAAGDGAASHKPRLETSP